MISMQILDKVSRCQSALGNWATFLTLCRCAGGPWGLRRTRGRLENTRPQASPEREGCRFDRQRIYRSAPPPPRGSAACPIMAATAWGESVRTTTSATSRKSSEMVGNRRDPSGTTSPPPPYVVGGGKSSPSPPGGGWMRKENGWPPGAGSAQGHVRAKPALGGEWGENIRSVSGGQAARSNLPAEWRFRFQGRRRPEASDDFSLISPTNGTGRAAGSVRVAGEPMGKSRPSATTLRGEAADRGQR